MDPLHSRGGVPLGLWVRGPARLDELGRSVAIVGSRSSTSYGEDIALELGARLAHEGFWVVSGAAFGIDQAAHRGALAAAAGSAGTVAVLATGVDRAYPAAHRSLLDYIAEVGAVVSEAAPGCAPTKVRFLARNRLIAAFSRGTVVVEAAVRSGALNTASWAGGLHRPVMGVPGPVTSEPSEGVHELLRCGGATLVTTAEHVLELVGGSGEHLVEVRRGRVRRRDRLTSRQQQVLDAVPRAPAPPRSRSARTAGIGLVEVSSRPDLDGPAGAGRGAADRVAAHPARARLTRAAPGRDPSRFVDSGPCSASPRSTPPRPRRRRSRRPLTRGCPSRWHRSSPTTSATWRPSATSRR